MAVLRYRKLVVLVVFLSVLGASFRLSACRAAFDAEAGEATIKVSVQGLFLTSSGCGRKAALISIFARNGG